MVTHTTKAVNLIVVSKISSQIENAQSINESVYCEKVENLGKGEEKKHFRVIGCQAKLKAHDYQFIDIYMKSTDKHVHSSVYSLLLFSSRFVCIIVCLITK